MAISRILGIETSCDETSAAVLRISGARPELGSLVILVGLTVVTWRWLGGKEDGGGRGL